MASPGGVEVARVSVRVVPDTSHLFADVSAELTKLERELSLDISASVDAAELTASAREAVATAQALAGNIDVKANIDTSQVGEIESVFKRASSGATGLLSSFSLLGAGASVLGLALVPLTAVLAGLVLALAAPLAIVAGGATIFGFLSGFAAKDVLAQVKKINALDTKLSGLTKGTQEYADTLAQLRTAQANLTPAQAAFAGALDKVKGAFDRLPKGVLLKPLTDAMVLLAKVIPDLTPIIKAVSGVLDDLIGQIDKVVQSPGFKGFVDTFAHQLGPDLKAFAAIAGNIFIGLGGLFSDLNDTLSKGVLEGLVGITDQFAEFGRNAKKNDGLKAFVNYVKQNLPLAGRLIGGTLGLLADAFAALAPAGHVVLEGLTGIVTQIGKLQGIAGPLAGALGAFGIGSFLGGPEVGAAAASVLVLVTAFKELYAQSKPLRQIIGDLGDYFRQTWLPLIQNAAKNIVPAFQAAIKDISTTIRDNKGLFEVLGKALVALGSAAAIAAIMELVSAIRLIGKAFKYGTLAVKVFANITLTIFENIVAGVGLLVGIILDQFSRIVDAAAAAFGFLPKVGGPIKDAQAKFHAFTDTVNGDISGVGDTLENLRTQINEVGNSHPSFHIDSNTLDQIRYMHQLDALRLKDKHLKITTTIEQQIDQVRGPGGGIQRPSGLSGGGAKAGSSGGAAVNIEKGYFTDTNDVLRKAGRRARARAGGGALLPPPLVPSFGG